METQQEVVFCSSQSQTCLPMMLQLYATLLLFCGSTSLLCGVFMTFGGERSRLGTGDRPRCHWKLRMSQHQPVEEDDNTEQSRSSPELQQLTLTL